MAQLLSAAGQVLRSGRVVAMRMTPKRASQEHASGADELASGFPNAPLSPGQADLGAGGQPSPSPARVLLRRMHAALARVGGGGRTPAESVEPSSLTFQGCTPERPRRPELARPSEVESHEMASEHILKELQRIIASQERIEGRFSVLHAEVKAEVQQVRAEVQEWRAEMEKKVRVVELNEAQLRTQILGTAEGLVRVEQNLQEEVAQMCAKLEMMQHEQEKKKGNEEEWLKALVREHVEKLAPQLEEKEDAKLREYQQSLEEWLKRGQWEFKRTIAEKVDKFIDASETKVTTVLEKCEELAGQLRKYETPLKLDDQWPQLEQEGPEQGQSTQKQREAPAELRYETEKLADNDQVEAQEEPTLDAAEVAADAQEMLEQERPEQGQPPQKQREAPEELRYEAEKLADNELGDKAASWQTQYQREKSEVSEGTDSCRSPNEGEPSGVAADTQEEPKLDAADAQGVPMLDLNQSEKNEATADAHMVGSRRSTLLYGDRNEHERIEGRPVYERTKVSELLADASGGSGTEGGMVLALRDMAGVVQDIQVRVGASTSVSRALADASGGSGTEGGMVLALLDMAGVVQDIQVCVGASTSVSKVRTEASHELRRRGVHSKLVSKLLFSGIFLKDDDIVRTTLLAATSQVGSKGLDARPVVHMLLAATSRTPKSTLTCLPDGDQEEHETTEFSVKPSSGVGRHTSNGSVSRSTFVISEHSDKNDVHENDAGGSGLSSGGFGASSAAPPSAPAVSGSFAFVVQDEGLDEKESDSDIVILLQDSTLDAEREKDILMRVSASSTGLQVRAGVLSELKRRGARKKLQRLCYLGKDLKDEADDDVVGAVQKNAPSPWGYAHTVVCMCLAKDTGDEAAAAQADAIFDRKADAIVARVAAKLRAEMTQLLSLSQGVAVA